MKSVLCVLAFALVVACEFQARIELSSETYHAGDLLFVNWELINNAESAHLLHWRTPLQGEWNSKMFSIVNEQGVEASYQGRLVKFAPPKEHHYVLMESNVPRSGKLLLSAGFHFYTPGTYSITLRTNTMTRDGIPVTLESNTVTLNVIEPDVRVPFRIAPRDGDVEFIGCDSEQEDILEDAIDNAKIASDIALEYMSQEIPPQCTSDYVEWFGVYQEGRWSTVNQNYDRLAEFFDERIFGIDCTCTDDSVYAYVFPDDPDHVIHVCSPIFWNAPADRFATDSQPGTLIHEASHFSDVAGTDDHAYGQSDCRELASLNPAQAVNNADSHQYFAEASPVCDGDDNEEPPPSTVSGCVGTKGAEHRNNAPEIDRRSHGNDLTNPQQRPKQQLWCP